MSDLTWTVEEMNDIAESFKKKAKAVFDKDGYHAPMCFLFATYDFREKKNARGVIPMMPESFKDEEAKDNFSGAIREISGRCRAVGLIFLTEMWMVKGGGTDLEEIRKWAGRIHKHPNRLEGMMMSIEHTRFGSKMFFAPIERPADNPGKPSLAPWETSGGTSYSGRFVHLLPQVA